MPLTVALLQYPVHGVLYSRNLCSLVDSSLSQVVAGLNEHIRSPNRRDKDSHSTTRQTTHVIDSGVFYVLTSHRTTRTVVTFETSLPSPTSEPPRGAGSVSYRVSPVHVEASFIESKAPS